MQSWEETKQLPLTMPRWARTTVPLINHTTLFCWNLPIYEIALFISLLFSFLLLPHMLWAARGQKPCLIQYFVSCDYHGTQQSKHKVNSCWMNTRLCQAFSVHYLYTLPVTWWTGHVGQSQEMEAKMKWEIFPKTHTYIIHDFYIMIETWLECPSF